MWHDIRQAHGDSWRFALLAPALFLIPAVAEFLQHVVEVEIGMYASRDAARAVADHPLRMAFGFVKVVALILPGYWFTRYVAWRDMRRAVAIERPAITLFLILLAIRAAAQAVQLFGPSPGAMLGLDGRAAGAVTAGLAIVSLVVGIYLTAWFVAWPLGNRACGPIVSARVMAGAFWRTLAITVATTLPLMALHYALGIGAIGRPVALVWAMLGVDALVVALLALTMTGGMAVAARTAAVRKRYPLIP